jgi:hypothetical protein
MRVAALAYSKIEVKELAIRVMRTRDGTHVGLLYRFQGELFLLDLMWHENLRVEKIGVDVREEPMLCVIPNFLPEEMNDATVTCALIVDRKLSGRDPQRIPYGFGLPLNARVNDEGELIWGGGVGLTCSTFVLAVLDAASIPFIDVSGWVNRPGDNERHAQLLNAMEEHAVHSEHIEKVRRELPCIRVRPEEVAAAALSPELPAKFNLVERTGMWILDWIRLGTSNV